MTDVAPNFHLVAAVSGIIHGCKEGPRRGAVAERAALAR
jgi:hypothetical protein